MTWLTWRQNRWEALIALAGTAGVVAVFAVSMGPTAEHLRHLPSFTNGCEGKLCFFASAASKYQTVAGEALAPVLWLGLFVIPALFGVFVGAPLLPREYESGTHRLIWAQGITRGGWLVTRAGWAALATLVLTGLVAAAVTAYNFVGAGRLWSSWSNFDYSLVVTGYAIFALALGIAAGALLRRTVPAMAVTLGLFVAVRVAVVMFLRPRFQAPLVSSRAFGDGYYDRQFDWVLNSTAVDAKGRTLTLDQVNRMVVQYQDAHPQADPGQILDNLGVVRHILYQPAERFWLFQGLETLIFLGLAAALIGFSVWWVRRRPA